MCLFSVFFPSYDDKLLENCEYLYVHLHSSPTYSVLANSLLFAFSEVQNITTKAQ